MQTQHLNVSYQYSVLMTNTKNEKSAKEIVLDAIKNADPTYVTIQEIADAANLARDTVSKYMLVLVAEKKIRITKKIGKVNLYEASD